MGKVTKKMMCFGAFYYTILAYYFGAFSGKEISRPRFSPSNFASPKKIVVKAEMESI